MRKIAGVFLFFLFIAFSDLSYGGITTSSGITQTAPVASVPSGASVYVTQQPPYNTDGANVGYALNQFWSYAGNFWYSIETANSGFATWQYQSVISAPTCNLVITCKAAYGTYLLLSSYAGNAFNITRSSDSTTLAVGFVNGVANWAAVNAFCLGTVCGVNTIYDQSGGGFDLTQSTFANMPRIYGSYATNKRGISFDGFGNTRNLSNAAITFTAVKSNTLALVASVTAQVNNITGADAAFLDIGNPTQVLTYYESPQNQDVSGLYYNQSGSNLKFTGLYPQQGVPSLYLFRSNNGPISAWVNNFTGIGNASLTATAATGLLLGGSTVAPSTPGSFDMSALVIYDSTVSTANIQLLQQSIYQDNGIQPQVTDGGILQGDSETCCVVMGGTNVPQATAWGNLLSRALLHPVYTVNLGINGLTLASMVTQATNYSTRLLRAGTNQFVVVWGGTNDIANSAVVTAATVYANMQTACATWKAAGYKCIIVSPLPRNSGFSGGQTSGGFEATRQSLETLLLANTTWADCYVDIVADPVIGPAAAAANATLFQDGIHVTNPVGNAYVLSDIAACARKVLP